MTAMPHEFDLSQATMLPPLKDMPRGMSDYTALADQWEAVHDAAAAVGVLAQLGREEPDAAITSLPQRAAELGGHHYAMVARGIDDLSAIMQSGLRALLALTAQGKDTTSAALTLWREFHMTRDTIVNIVPAV